MDEDAPPGAARSKGCCRFLRLRGLVVEPLDAADRSRIESVIIALGDRLKVFSDILKLGRFFFTRELGHDPDAVKKRLRKEGVAAMLAELGQLLGRAVPYDPPTLEKAVHDYAEHTGPQDGRRGQPFAGGDHRAGGRPGAVRLSGHSWASDVPGPDRADSWHAQAGALVRPGCACRFHATTRQEEPNARFCDWFDCV